MMVNDKDLASLQKQIDSYYLQISENKKRLIQTVLPQRARYMTIVLEDTFQSFNASAILRTAEIFGIQDIHVVAEKNRFRPTVGICRGAIQWLRILQYANTADCIATLKDAGYLIAATSLDYTSIPLEKMQVNQKIALVFGNELVGIKPETMKLADIKIHIPMVGFTKSFNLSVSVALCLQELLKKIKSSGLIWQLTETEKKVLEYNWCKQIVQRK